ncbi:DUF3419 family protein [Streptomyces sp. NPDC048337]|uniref:DUF3419 family protein n=1 Tax=Streptomyces sp. NPDC048337 TaxID=3365535 RepID=UPI003716012F
MPSSAPACSYSTAVHPPSPAVHPAPPPPYPSPVGRLFSALHGRNLVYNACWEDPGLDRAALGLGSDDHVLVITSGGCNALDYLLAGAGRVTAVDVNPRQGALLELKRAGVRRLSHGEFFELFGQGRSARAREMYGDALRAELTAPARRYWDSHIGMFAGSSASRADTFYYHGTSGLLARALMLVLRRVQGLGPAFEELFAAPTPERQREVYESRLRAPLWTVARLAARPTALCLAGVPPQQRREISEEYPGGPARLVHDGFDAVFGRLPLADNYFWRAYVMGSYTPDCCPEYLKAENFARLREALPRLEVRTGTVTAYLHGEGRARRGGARATGPAGGSAAGGVTGLSKFVLLDHMDWMGWADQPALAREWQAILGAARPGARVIYRSAGLRTRYLDPVRVVHEGRTRRLVELLHRHPDQARELHQRDRVHTYGSFHIADLP